MTEVRRKHQASSTPIKMGDEILILSMKLRAAVARLNKVYSCGMISKTSLSYADSGEKRLRTS
jgi:hypothetical protein